MLLKCTYVHSLLVNTHYHNVLIIFFDTYFLFYFKNILYIHVECARTCFSNLAFGDLVCLIILVYPNQDRCLAYLPCTHFAFGNREARTFHIPPVKMQFSQCAISPFDSRRIRSRVLAAFYFTRQHKNSGSDFKKARCEVLENAERFLKFCEVCIHSRLSRAD